MKNGGVTKATDKSAIEISSKKLAEMGEKKSVNIFDLAQQQLVQKRGADDARERLWSARQTAVDAGGPEEKGRVADSEAAESTMVFCGAPNSGKTSLLARFLDSASARTTTVGDADRTVALEYSFSSRPTASGGRQLVHCWELAGNSMADLLEIPLSKRAIHSTALLIFLDLTRPEQFQAILEPMLRVCRKRMEQMQLGTTMEMPGKQGLEAQPNSTELRIRRPLGIPLVFMCSRYDEFQNLDSERKRMIYRLLRLVAHINGASILTISIRMDSLVKMGLSLLSHLAFGTQPPPRSFATDPQHPLMVFPNGMDSLEKIDPSPEILSMGSFSDAMFYFLHSLNQAFPQQKLQNNGMLGGEDEQLAADQQFAEPAIDILVDDRMRKLELYAKERRNRMEAEQKSATDNGDKTTDVKGSTKENDER